MAARGMALLGLGGGSFRAAARLAGLDGSASRAAPRVTYAGCVPARAWSGRLFPRTGLIPAGRPNPRSQPGCAHLLPYRVVEKPRLVWISRCWRQRSTLTRSYQATAPARTACRIYTTQFKPPCSRSSRAVNGNASVSRSQLFYTEPATSETKAAAMRCPPEAGRLPDAATSRAQERSSAAEDGTREVEAVIKEPSSRPVAVPGGTLSGMACVDRRRACSTRKAEAPAYLLTGVPFNGPM